jgi:hypothetical protein
MPQYAANTFAVLPKFPEISDYAVKPKNKAASVYSESSHSSNSVHIIIKVNTKGSLFQDRTN